MLNEAEKVRLFNKGLTFVGLGTLRRCSKIYRKFSKIARGLGYYKHNCFICIRGPKFTQDRILKTIENLSSSTMKRKPKILVTFGRQQPRAQLTVSIYSTSSDAALIIAADQSITISPGCKMKKYIAQAVPTGPADEKIIYFWLS